MDLRTATPSAAEQVVIERARALFASRPAKAMALLDGDKLLYVEYKAPADSDAYFSGFSVGKTVTAMAVGQALCDGKLALDTTATDLIPELKGKALGAARVRDLLRMASGAAEPNPDSSVWTPEEFQRWRSGDLDLLALVTQDRVARAARGFLSAYQPGEHFSYKQTDPFVLGIMVGRATGVTLDQWLQARVLDPMGAARRGIYQRDRQFNGLADSGFRLRFEDWLRLGVWIQRASKEAGCFGDFVRAAMSRQIANDSTPAARKAGGLFDGYGYLTWVDNVVVPNSAWAVGWGGQRIGWDHASNRMLVLFSNREDWMAEVYALARDWFRLGP
jgi:CubicO group peptidase (beta-lactamase class C family)